MRLSVVIPAFNEAKRITATLESVREAARGAGVQDYEVIVSDDASTDETAELARGAGARVVLSGKRNIGATRNVGAAAAKGRYILFLDADTRANPAALSAMLQALDGGAVGGGLRLDWIERVSWSARLLLEGWNLISPLFKLPAGGFLFVRREDFQAVGGFDERWYASEELHLAAALKRRGKVVILKERASTSAHKFERFSARDVAALLLRAAVSPRRALRDRKFLAFWYERR